MRALVRRVTHASVSVGNESIGEINSGLLVYLGVDRDDEESDASWLVKKMLGLRIFEDGNGRMSHAIPESDGILVVSQFTLFGNLQKGFRPSFNQAADPAKGKGLYEHFLVLVNEEFKGNLHQGAFGEEMKINATDDGPVSIWIDSKNRKY